MPSRHLLLLIVGGIVLGLSYYFLALLVKTLPRMTRLRLYLNDPAAHADWQINAGDRCGSVTAIFWPGKASTSAD